MPTIGNGTTTETPLLVKPYESSRESRNITHSILSTNVKAVSLRPAGLRTGRLEALTASRADAAALEAVLAGATLLTYTDSDTSLSMTFILDGVADVKQDTEVLARWWVTFDFTEVT